jgi:hypothetical protein
LIKRKLALAEKFSGPLRFHLRQVLLYISNDDRAPVAVPLSVLAKKNPDCSHKFYLLVSSANNNHRSKSVNDLFPQYTAVI